MPAPLRADKAPLLIPAPNALIVTLPAPLIVGVKFEKVVLLLVENFGSVVVAPTTELVTVIVSLPVASL